MRASWMYLVGALLAAVAAGAAAGGPEPEADGLEKAATGFVDLLAAGEFSQAVERFDATMKEALPAEKLAEVWKTLNAQAGPFRQRAGVRAEKQDPYRIVFVTCRFEKASLDAKIVFDASAKIAGLFFVPAEGGAAWGLPDYARPDAYREVEVTVGAGRWALPGTLAIPAGPGPFPGAVLVHGSGPGDRDGTIGPNRPLHDLAAGLASRGVAVLRYDKRTRAHAAAVAAEIESLTLEEETIADALAAVSRLRAVDRVDSRRLFVLGHSLGGVAAPRIGERDPALAGLILLAAPARPLEEVLVDQLAYLAALDGEVSAEEKERIESVRSQVETVKRPALLATAPPGSLPLGLSRAYWQYLARYSAPDVAARLRLPMLILHGGRDYQTTAKDLARWRAALAERSGITFRLYPGLNHLFVAGESRSSPDEYLVAGHVAREVVEDLAGWIAARPAAPAA